MNIHFNKFWEKYSFLFYNKFSWIALFFIAYTLLFKVFFVSLRSVHITYIAFAIVSYIFWTSIGVILHALPKKIANFLTFILSFVWSVLILTAPFLFKEFKEFLSIGLVLLLKEQPVYFWGYVHQITHTFWQISAIILLTLVLFFIFRIKNRLSGKNRIKLVTGAIVLILLNNVFLNVNYDYYKTDFINFDVHTFYSLRKGMHVHSKNKPLLHVLSPDWDKNLPSPPEEKYNVVLVVFESLSKIPLPFYGFDNNYMPFLTNWMQKDSTQFIRFKNALSLSGATHVSMPSIFTGVGPERDYYDLVYAPFLWDYAKKASYHTMLINIQSQTWRQFNRFVGDSNADYYFYPEKLGLSFINDLGADGPTVLKLVKPEILKLKSPYFLYFNTNATHVPFQDHSPQIKDFKGITNRYGKALFISDQTVKSLIDILKQKGDFDRTIVLFTADHGAYAIKRRQRGSSYFKETLDIPMMVYLPKKWIDSHRKLYQTIKSNRNKRVTNLDIAPTVYHLIFDKDPSGKPVFSGKSLLTPINNDRAVIALTTNDIRSWSSEGFGIYKDTVSYIFHDNTGFHYYNVAKDSMQYHDLIKEIPPERKHYFDSIIQHNKYLRAVLKRAQAKYNIK